MKKSDRNAIFRLDEIRAICSCYSREELDRNTFLCHIALFLQDRNDTNDTNDIKVIDIPLLLIQIYHRRIDKKEIAEYLSENWDAIINNEKITNNKFKWLIYHFLRSLRHVAEASELVIQDNNIRNGTPVLKGTRIGVFEMYHYEKAKFEMYERKKGTVELNLHFNNVSNKLVRAAKLFGIAWTEEYLTQMQRGIEPATEGKNRILQVLKP